MAVRLAAAAAAAALALSSSAVVWLASKSLLAVDGARCVAVGGLGGQSVAEIAPKSVLLLLLAYEKWTEAREQNIWSLRLA